MRLALGTGASKFRYIYLLGAKIGHRICLGGTYLYHICRYRKVEKVGKKRGCQYPAAKLKLACLRQQPFIVGARSQSQPLLLAIQGSLTRGVRVPVSKYDVLPRLIRRETKRRATPHAADTLNEALRANRPSARTKKKILQRDDGQGFRHTRLPMLSLFPVGATYPRGSCLLDAPLPSDPSISYQLGTRKWVQMTDRRAVPCFSLCAWIGADYCTG